MFIVKRMKLTLFMKSKVSSKTRFVLAPFSMIDGIDVFPMTDTRGKTIAKEEPILFPTTCCCATCWEWISDGVGVIGIEGAWVEGSLCYNLQWHWQARGLMSRRADLFLPTFTLTYYLGWCNFYLSIIIQDVYILLCLWKPCSRPLQLLF